MSKNNLVAIHALANKATPNGNTLCCGNNALYTLFYKFILFFDQPMPKWLSNLVVQYRARNDTEHEQMLLRIVFAAALIVWFLYQFSAVDTRLPLRYPLASTITATLYGAMAIFGLAWLHFNGEPSHRRRIAWIFIDAVMLAVVCYVAGKASIPLLFFYVWLPVDNGYRYGPRYLICATVLVAITLLGSILFAPYWAPHRMLAVGVFLNTIILVLYTGYLIDQINKTSAKLQELATRDILTNLPNRRFFVEHLKRAMILTHRSKQYCACVFLDLDGFKYVNDTHGHAIGDLLLIEVSRRIENNLRDTDLLSRFGGDEFAIVTQCHKIPGDAITVSHRILSLLNGITEIAGCPIKISASIGISWYQNDDKHVADPDALIKNADLAMYSAKKAGKNCAHVVDDHGQISEVTQWIDRSARGQSKSP